MRHEGDATIVTALRPIFLCSTLIVASFDCCGTRPRLHTATTISWKFTKLSESHSSTRIFRSSTRRPSGPTALRFAIARIASSTLYLDGTSSSGLHEGTTLSSSVIVGSITGWRFRV